MDAPFALLLLAAPLFQEPTATTPDPWAAFEASAAARHGEFGARCASFLRENMPPGDEGLDQELLEENLFLALAARETFPWAKGVSEEMFLSDVLPYAVMDETRERWRPEMFARVVPIVMGCTSMEDAAMRINDELFDVVNVHYNTGRKRPNASPSESIAQGRATCTGLTILMVDACRAAGIPARAAGVFRWHDDRGNHTWVEVWDGERWRFCGADEHDPAGLDRGWFTGDAAKATAGDREHAVWASTWRRGGASFPLAWAQKSERVAAVEVTDRYARAAAAEELAALGSAGEELGEEAAGRVIMALWKERRAALAEEFKAEDEAHAFQAAGQVLKVKERRFGDAPEGKRSLWISMHGGGGAPARVNDGQWDNQIKLYEPEEGIYVAPRAPTDTWNLWHQGHIDPLFDRMIASYVTRHGVDPDRVYLMGYSAGGDGVYQLAPRMADRYAAAAMMAGHPNETRPDGLRNLPFMIFMGGKDSAYKRNEIAAQWKETLAGLSTADEGGYEHLVTIYPGKGHWMDREDRSALPWMAARTRNAWPKKVVWLQDDVRGQRFYWLELVEKGDGADRARVEAEVKGQTIAVKATGLDRLALRLRDDLIDLDQDITVTFDGQQVFQGRVPRTRATIEASLDARADPRTACTARLVIERP